ncbi:hypothetical protein C8K36_108197 [Rhodococcus sp. OK519]|uniref:hypothetical protein n=1 Tax=Rhodococcus sp. OK519 TaxID=2135729 RepID=UPI000D3D36AF|nr:hypothetical protein C8K36_108197 [Rhodococcus sp. OK519]
MLVIIGLILLVAAVVIAIAGVLTNGGTDHAITDDFSIFGYHVTGSTGTLFLYGIVVGAVGVVGLALLLAGARRSSRRGRAARNELDQIHRADSARADQQRNTPPPPPEQGA